MEKILIKGGRIVDPAQDVDMVGDLLLSEGKVAGIEKSIPSSNGARVLDAAGMVVSPGFIDLHCHLRDPGLEYKETIASGHGPLLRAGSLRSARCPTPNRQCTHALRSNTCWRRRERRARFVCCRLAVSPKGRWARNWPR